MTWGDIKGFNVSFGADMTVFANNYNEFDAFNFSVFTPPGSAPSNTGLPVNLGIPMRRQIDPGLLVDVSIPLGDRLAFQGRRPSRFRHHAVPRLWTQRGPDATTLFSRRRAVATEPSCCFPASSPANTSSPKRWKALAGYGYAERAPTLTELYSGGASSA